MKDLLYVQRPLVFSLDIVLIHNQDPDRVEAMREVMRVLQASAPAHTSVYFAEDVWWQPENLSHSILSRAKWVLANSQTQAMISKFMRSQHSSSALTHAVAFLASLVSYSLLELKNALIGNLSYARHLQLSRKHNVAWLQFLNSPSSDWLLVLEDDALFTHAGRSEFWKILDEVKQWPVSSPSFVHLSEGLELKKLKVKEDFFELTSPFLKSPIHPFTNTTAAYLLNKPLAEYFSRALQAHPRLTLNTADFQINNLMLRWNREHETGKTFCLHAVSPPFQNASINAGLGSSISG